jgi:hypothetical protein
VFELYHVFVLVDAGAPEADRLRAFGLVEGEPNVHPGQGTACRRFFFRNAYLELVWVSDPSEAQADPVIPTQLWSRWSGRRSSASPFGVCLRPARPEVEGVPFPSWEYRPPYLPSPLAIHVGQDIPLSEPWWGYLSFGRRPDSPDRPRRPPLVHPVGFRELTRLRLTTPAAASLSATAVAASRAGAVALEHGPDHLLEMTFDEGARGLREDFRPALPLVFRW